MIPVSVGMQKLLAANQRAPWVDILVTYPDKHFTDTGTTEDAPVGASLVLDSLLSITIQRNEEPTSDALDFEIANGDARYSPLRVH